MGGTIASTVFANAISGHFTQPTTPKNLTRIRRRVNGAIEALCIGHPGAWKLSKAVFECCIIVLSLYIYSGFVYLLQREAVTTVQNITFFSSWALYGKSKPLGSRLVSNIHFCLIKRVLT